MWKRLTEMWKQPGAVKTLKYLTFLCLECNKKIKESFGSLESTKANRFHFFGS